MMWVLHNHISSCRVKRKKFLCWCKSIHHFICRTSLSLQV